MPKSHPNQEAEDSQTDSPQAITDDNTDTQQGHNLTLEQGRDTVTDDNEEVNDSKEPTGVCEPLQIDRYHVISLRFSGFPHRFLR